MVTEDPANKGGTGTPAGTPHPLFTPHVVLAQTQHRCLPHLARVTWGPKCRACTPGSEKSKSFQTQGVPIWAFILANEWWERLEVQLFVNSIFTPF